MDPILIPLCEDKLKAPVYHLVGSSWDRLWISQIKKKKIPGYGIKQRQLLVCLFPQYLPVYVCIHQSRALQ